jgi:hypothetical protein
MTDSADLAVPRNGSGNVVKAKLVERLAPIGRALS